MHHLRLIVLIVLGIGLAAGADDAEWRKRTGVDPGRGQAQVRDETKPAATAVDPATVPGLALWLDAATGVTLGAHGRVVGWADRSGRGQDLGGGEDEYRPARVDGALNGMPVLRFTGSQHVAQGLSRERFALGAGDGFTAIALLRQRRPSVYATFFHYGADDGVQGAAIGLNALGGSIGSTKEFSGTIGSGVQLPGSGYRVIAMTGDGASGAQALFADGAEAATATNPAPIAKEGPFLLGGTRIGATNCAGGGCFDLAELLVFDRALTAKERQGVEAYLRQRWGLDSAARVSSAADRLPFAYYPSLRQIELAFACDAPLLQEYFDDIQRPAATPARAAPGLAWATFAGDQPPEDPAQATPTRTGTVAVADLPVAGFAPAPGTPFALSGWLDVPKPGVYAFQLRPQIAATLWIDDVLVARQGDLWNQWLYTGSGVGLKAGKHRVRIDGKACARIAETEGKPLVLWSGADFWCQPLPEGALSHSEPMAFPRPGDDDAEPGAPPAALRGLKQAPFAVLDIASGKAVATGTLALDQGGHGQARFPVGDLPDGEYGIEYRIAGAAVRLPTTFRRIHFPWEGNALGTEHTVFAPFTPVAVKDATVGVVGRSYRLGGFGVPESIVSLGQELLAAPITVIAKAGGTQQTWRQTRPVGKALYDDLAEFAGSAECDAIRLAARTAVQEDGCLRVEWTLTPGAKPAPVEWLELIVPLDEKQAPLFGWSAVDSMRRAYWGAVPPKAAIDWLPGGWAPAAWTLGKAAAPADGRVWDSTDTSHWSPGNRDDFACYVWLGGAERGLAWFADQPAQFAHDGVAPVQLVCREAGRVTLHVRIIQQPTTLDAPRSVVFGLQASPTKPMAPDWRRHQVAGGGGPTVVCWGGYFASSKYPDNHDFSVVDTILKVARAFPNEGEKQATMAACDQELQALDAKRVWRDQLVFGDTPWLKTQRDFLVATQWGSCAAYVQEHGNHPRMVECQVFIDEWATGEFPRGQGGGGGMLAPSYADFCLYYHNEYLRRGVSIYFDNTMPRYEAGPALPEVREWGRASSLWRLRDYYRRVWKQLRRLEADKVPPRPIDFTLHITNCQILPWTSWATATLDLEQPYRVDPSRRGPRVAGGNITAMMTDGFHLPFPPDYTRAQSMGRQAGVIAHGMFPLANYNDYRDGTTEQWTPEQALADWGMYRVHEMRGFYQDWRKGMANAALWWAFQGAMRDAGYGDPAAQVINYWAPQAPVSVQAPEQVTWLAVLPPAERRQAGLLGGLLLQSYATDGATAAVAWAGATALVDFRSGKQLGTATAEVRLPGCYGTALVWAVADPAAAPRLDPK